MIYLNKVFEMKKIIYDFDGTLTPFSIPRFSILEKCGYEDGALNPKFLNEVKTMMKNENLDLYDTDDLSDAVGSTYLTFI